MRSSLAISTSCHRWNAQLVVRYERLLGAGEQMHEQDNVAKCAWRLIPFMVLLYLVSFIGRTNAGFAALTMNKDLGFSPAVFGFGAGMFFAGF